MVVSSGGSIGLNSWTSLITGLRTGVARLESFLLLVIVMLMKECKICKRLIPYGQGYCEKCRPIAEARAKERLDKFKREANRRYNKKRNPEEVRFYNSKGWRSLAAARLQHDGYKCKICGQYATEIDHIVPIQTPEGWTRRYDWDNLQSLCTQCHNKKHDRYQSKKKRHQTVAK